MDLKQAPKTVDCDSNAGIVIVDEISDDPLSILPKNTAHARIAYCER